jgi:succinyl-CoA synthetase beta subunit
MKLHEYQAKALMAQYGIPLPRGGVASTPEEARQQAQELGGRIVVKAQVHAGGRGAAGGVRVVGSPAEAEEYASSLLGSNLVTAQTGPEGVPVTSVLVEEAAEVAQELYLAMLVDGGTRRPVAIASAAGGMEIEEVAMATPEKVLRAEVDPVLGLQPFQGRRLAYSMELAPELVRPTADLATRLYRLFVEKDCTLAEINPLAVTADGRVVALDAKVDLDDDAAFRHRDLQTLRDVGQEDALEARAREVGVSYVRLDGDVGCLVNGAGLAMATMDIVKAVGAEPANFLDVGGGANEEQVKQGFGIILADPRVKRVLVNVFGGILRCDMVAQGVVAACREAESRPLIVARLQGTNAEEGRQVFRDSGLPVELAGTLREAAEKLQEVVGP